MVVLSGFKITLARSLFTCSARRIRIRRENALEKKKKDAVSQKKGNQTYEALVQYSSGHTDVAWEVPAESI